MRRIAAAVAVVRSAVAVVALFAASPSASAQQPGADWWAYRPLQRPAVPDVGADPFVTNDIDRFVLARLRERGLSPSPMASREVLVRRLCYDLTGLPPSPEEVTAFVVDQDPQAYEHLVDRLLASPQYGVAWGRHWLDLVRYAETNSFERDGTKPEVWRYRDWVVDAWNRDLPYGDFLRQQLAGDEEPESSIATVTATGYLRLGLWDDEPTDPLQAVYDDLDSMADTTARAMLGISIGCARCHDHKKDPITTRDYYAFLAFFEHLQPYRPTTGNGGNLTPSHYTRVLPAEGAVAAFATAQRDFAQRREASAAQAVASARAAYVHAAPSSRVVALRKSAAGVVARYRADRPDAARLVDDTGKNDGTIEGQLVAVDGRSGTALRADGDDRAFVPVTVRDSFTIEFFVRSTARGRGREDAVQWFYGDGLVDGEVPGVTNDFGVSWFGDGRIVAGTGAPDVSIASPPGLADGQWHHVAFTRDRRDGALALYVDGARVATGTGSTAALDAPTRCCLFDLQVGGHGFAGDLDEIVFHERVLSAAEIAAAALSLPPAAVALDPAAERACAAMAELTPPVLATTMVLCARERRGEPDKSYVRIRGDVHSRGAEVAPALPAVLGAQTPAIVPAADGSSSGRRRALAQWITAPDNPLTWRVAANRLWQFHFGRGLCRTPNDFGRLGELPTHPELLDWLASEFVARGGSMKAMHRLLVTSSTYRMSCAVDPERANRDPGNDAFWRFDRRRLFAEELRDSMLAVAGTLQLSLGGPSVYPPLPAAVLATASRPDEAWGTSSPQDAARRSIYIHQKRSLLEPLLAAFDLADTDSSCPVRFSTVQPTQALMLLNGAFAQSVARDFAARLQRQAPASVEAQLELGIRLATQRPPEPADIARLVDLHRRLVAEHGRDPASALQRCCLLLLNQNEFAYLD